MSAPFQFELHQVRSDAARRPSLRTRSSISRFIRSTSLEVVSPLFGSTVRPNFRSTTSPIFSSTLRSRRSGSASSRFLFGAGFCRHPFVVSNTWRPDVGFAVAEASEQKRSPSRDCVIRKGDC